MILSKLGLLEALRKLDLNFKIINDLKVAHNYTGEYNLIIYIKMKDDPSKIPPLSFKINRRAVFMYQSCLLRYKVKTLGKEIYFSQGCFFSSIIRKKLAIKSSKSEHKICALISSLFVFNPSF